ncbi:MAG TPA: A/G-specific adenine glycosylase [Caulobacteraceae bacterium]|nr:A/G-specific adenine glycosylase [Caulobacteraceae bacterium]
MIEVERLRAALLDWYDQNRRALPWRATPGVRPDPYRVWLSEVMLQQTTTVHAAPYFETFTRRWPTVAALARAEDAEVMASWAGLGYYARARNLLACARAVSERHGGLFPAREAGLRSLPGIGAYTAAAVAAIAFDEPANVVDGNVERVMARLSAEQTPMPAAKPRLEALAARFVRDDRSGDWAQALMDLGATVCRPRAPACERCPWQGDCAARAGGEPQTYPRRSAKAERPRRRGVAFVLRCAGAVALTRRPPRGLLGGMLALPTTAWTQAGPAIGDIETTAPARGAWRDAGAIEHVFTHFALTLDVRVLETCARGDGDGHIWLDWAQARAATPSVFAKALDRGAAPP